MIRVTDPILTSDEAREHVRTMVEGKEFDTENGEMPDAMARTVASQYQTSGTVGSELAALASGASVGRWKLADDVAATGRAHGWPVDLEYLSTWVLNHD